MSNEPAEHRAGPPAIRESLPPKLGAITSGKRVAAIVPETMDDAYRLAKAIASSGIAPRGYTKGKGSDKQADPEAIMVGIMHGLEVGLTPMAALQSIAVINGMPTIWGDGADRASSTRAARSRTMKEPSRAS